MTRHIIAIVAAAGALSAVSALPDFPSLTAVQNLFNMFGKAAKDGMANLGLRGGGEPGDAGSYACCANYGDGTYGANISLLATTGRTEVFTHGSVFANAKTEEYIFGLGDYCPANSKAGMYLYRSNDTPKTIKAVLWHGKKCRTVDVPSRCMSDVPKMCVGDSKSPLSQFLTEWNFDSFTSIRAFGSNSTRAAALVSKRTCMPWGFGMHAHWKHLSEGLAGVHDLPMSMLGIDDSEVTKKALFHLAILFQNGTSDTPPAKAFTPPSFCDA